MSVTINFKSNFVKKKSENLVLFFDDNFDTTTLKKYISGKEYSYISDLILISDKKNKIISYDISSKKKIVLISIKKQITASEAESLGAKFYDQFKNTKLENFQINTDTATNKLKNFVGYFLHGVRLKSYIFEKYKSKKIKKNIHLNVIGKISHQLRIKLDLNQLKKEHFLLEI